MSNSLTPKSPANAAALDITLAVIANTTFAVNANAKTPAENGAAAAEFANAIFNSVLENIKQSK